MVGVNPPKLAKMVSSFSTSAQGQGVIDEWTPIEGFFCFFAVFPTRPHVFPCFFHAFLFMLFLRGNSEKIETHSHLEPQWTTLPFLPGRPQQDRSLGCNHLGPIWALGPLEIVMAVMRCDWWLLVSARSMKNGTSLPNLANVIDKWWEYLGFWGCSSTQQTSVMRV